MADDTYYITTHEAALAVVATLMKKSRLRLDTLILTSILGGMFFSAGGMIYFLIQAGFHEAYETNPGIIHLLQGALYPFGLFFVVIMGTDLYNSNILFFTVGVLRGAVSVLDLLISWFVSLIFNMLGSLFVVYVLCHLSKSTTSEEWVILSKQLLDTKLSFSFVENMIKGIPCNFLVLLLIYLQLMSKPLHVKFLMMFLPVFTFVSMGFNHVVADMFIIPLALLNNSDWTVGQYLWRSFIPSVIGNAIGGAAFGLMVPWYLHLYVVEMDMKNLNLPEYEERDEQPEQGMDSRVVRVSSQSHYDDEKLGNSSNEDEETTPTNFRPIAYRPSSRSRESLMLAPTQTRGSVRSASGLSRFRSNTSNHSMRLRLVRSRNSLEYVRSPKGVFPVLGMGAPYANEKKVAGEYDDGDEKSENEVADIDGDETPMDEYIPNVYDPEASKMSGNLRKIISRRKLSNDNDIEMQRKQSGSSGNGGFFRNSFSLGSGANLNDYYNISRAATQAGLTQNSINMSDDVAGIHPRSINLEHHKNEDIQKYYPRMRPLPVAKKPSSGRTEQEPSSTESTKSELNDVPGEMDSLLSIDSSLSDPR